MNGKVIGKQTVKISWGRFSSRNKWYNLMSPYMPSYDYPNYYPYGPVMYPMGVDYPPPPFYYVDHMGMPIMYMPPIYQEGNFESTNENITEEEAGYTE